MAEEFGVPGSVGISSLLPVEGEFGDGIFDEVAMDAAALKNFCGIFAGAPGHVELGGFLGIAGGEARVLLVVSPCA